MTGAFLRCLAVSAATGSLLSSAAIAAPPPAPTGKRWVPIPEITDNFNQASLDLRKWRPTSGYSWTGKTPFQFDPANVSIEDGALVLRTTSAARTRSDIGDVFKTTWLRTAIVTSVYSRITYGYYEARMRASRLPTTSSFWLKGNEGPHGGRRTEIDVTEAIGAPRAAEDTTHRMWSSLHYYRDGHVMSATTTAHIRTDLPVAEWHTYGAWWRDPNTVWFYLDGTKVSEQTMKAPFDEKMKIFFDTEWIPRFGMPELRDLANPEMNAMRIDWVRAYRLVPRTP